MIVIATQQDPPHHWRKPGTRFAVQEVSVVLPIGVSFRVEASDGTPALVEAEHFDVVDGTIPETWAFFEMLHGGYVFRPRAWSEPGFWEDWMEDEPEALEAYAKFRSTLD